MNPLDSIIKGVLGVFDQVYYSDEEKARDQQQKELAEEKLRLEAELRKQREQTAQNVAIGAGVVALVGIITWGVVASKKAA
ncbi:hypothetical protein Mesil_1767 [Allomeiothermus silvanus DSM 9946]|uniref:Uncharacterized protein n=1 Tax=Allomeiothermus silvanus (strain ATCC 700542 / DSM 9946 / NBRC 106475 / NCIMB 13440 / VI-R2) TaxID=526227 RepID=D7BFU2_ALLS1|nr:hypothetical protein [Allomeiothermus silvanus]ADH63645.1 hypothetical protein Mesil_1767 [Allomeiothermus silvanus DSM 9946]